MPIVTVIHTTITSFEVPEGCSINHLRMAIDQSEDLYPAEEALREAHRAVLAGCYGEGQRPVEEDGQGNKIEVLEGHLWRRNP